MANWPEIMFLGQSGFHLMFGATNLLIDPSNKKSGDVDGEVVYCTHKHFDHTRGVSIFLERNPEAVLVGNEQVIEGLDKWRSRAIESKLGERLDYGDFTLEFVKCKHGFFRGIIVHGIIVRAEGFSFGHCGDSITLEGFYDKGLDLLALPISGLVATSPKSALEELRRFKRPLPKVIPMHWLFRRPGSFCRLFHVEFPDGKCILPEEGKPIPT